MAGPLPQKNRFTKRADDWRKQWADRPRPNVIPTKRAPIDSPWKTSKRRRPINRGPTYDTWYAGWTRAVNKDTPRGAFLPEAKLDPSVVEDQRYRGLVEDIASWFFVGVNTPRWWQVPYDTGKKVQAKPDTTLGKLQTSHHQWMQNRVQPQPGPAPTPARNSRPGLLSKYRR